MRKQRLMQMVLTVGNRDIKMKAKLWLLLATSIAFPMATVAQENTRSHLKCYLQLEDNSKVVHQFVNGGAGEKAFINSLAGRSVFMADGVTEKKIESVYECVALKNNFRRKDAIAVEKNTPF